MVRTLLVRGMLVGLVAGVLAFGFARLFGVPEVDLAIAFEEQLSEARGEAPETELVSRAVQSGMGLFAAATVYGTALGGLFALVFAAACGRVGNLSPRATAALLAAAGFVSLVVIPGLKYPGNPPAVGDPETIAYRTGLYFLMILVSVTAVIAAIRIGAGSVLRYGTWNAALIGSAVFLGAIAAVSLLLPDVNEVSDQFPAAVLWRFRIASLGMQFVLWLTIGVLFGVAAERALTRRGESHSATAGATP